MRRNKLKQLIQEQSPIINGWLAIPSSYSAEIVGHQGYDAVTVDLQHGMIDFASALTMLQALSATPAVPLVRVQHNDPAQIMRMLDDFYRRTGRALRRRLPLSAVWRAFVWPGARAALRRSGLSAARLPGDPDAGDD